MHSVATSESDESGTVPVASVARRTFTVFARTMMAAGQLFSCGLVSMVFPSSANRFCRLLSRRLNFQAGKRFQFLPIEIGNSPEFKSIMNPM